MAAAIDGARGGDCQGRLLLWALLLLAAHQATATYSIIAVDHAVGTVGCAVTSCVGGQDTEMVCAGHPRAGVVAAQALLDPTGRARDEAVEMLRQGELSTGEILDRITNTSFDEVSEFRQYGICEVVKDSDETPKNQSCSSFTGAGPQSCYEGIEGMGKDAFSSCYAGSTDVYIDGYAASFQGNVLTSERVLEQAKAAFVAIDGSDAPESLASRLMAALLAGADNGEGDVRCRDKPSGLASDSAHLLVLSPPGTPGERNYSLSVTGTEGLGEAVELLEKEYIRESKEPSASAGLTESVADTKEPTELPTKAPTPAEVPSSASAIPASLPLVAAALASASAISAFLVWV